MAPSHDTYVSSAVPGTPRPSRILAGPLGGIAGGLVMIAVLVTSAAVQGLEPLAAVEPMGATFAQPDSLDGSSGRVLYGLVLHLGVSALAGLVFAAVLPRDFPAGSAGLLCVGFAFIVMGFMTSMIVPAVNPALVSGFHDLGGSWVLAHALFGATTGLVCQRLRQGFSVRAGRSLRHRTA